MCRGYGTNLFDFFDGIKGRRVVEADDLIRRNDLLDRRPPIREEVLSRVTKKCVCDAVGEDWKGESGKPPSGLRESAAYSSRGTADHSETKSNH